MVAEPRDQAVSVRMSKSIREITEAAAAAENRKLADYVYVALLKDLKSKGLIKD